MSNRKLTNSRSAAPKKSFGGGAKKSFKGGKSKFGSKPGEGKKSREGKPERKFTSRFTGDSKKTWGEKPERKEGFKSTGKKTFRGESNERNVKAKDSGTRSWRGRRKPASRENDKYDAGKREVKGRTTRYSKDKKEAGESSWGKSNPRGERGYRARTTNQERTSKPRAERKSTVEKVNERFAQKKKIKQDAGQEKRPFKKEYNKKDSGKRGYQKSYEKKRKEQPEVMESFEGEIRLNRYLSNAGICSRREADELITAGLVSVNGVIITELGSKVKPGDDVRFNDERLSTERKVYLIMNKPKDTITTLDDPDKRRIVTDLIIGHQLPRVYPVGRLDRNTTGVLILTNDGELSQRLMHPKYGVQKVYKATLNKNFKGEDLWKLANGVELEDGFIKPDAVVMPDPAHKNEVLVELHSGKNRIVHRMFEHLGYTLDKLDRVVYAGFNKKALSRGEWRELNEREIKQLKKLVQL